MTTTTRTSFASARAAEMCAAAEAASGELPDSNPRAIYVVGTEVPIPGGERSEAAGSSVTTIEDAAQRIARKYSYSDRCRYYWPAEAVRPALDRLIENLRRDPPPLTLVSQLLPSQYGHIRAGALTNDPLSLIHDRIRQVLHHYSAACGII